MDTEQTDKTFEEEEVERMNALESTEDEVKVPYLPAVKDDVFTLVLDLDETLVHY